MSSYWRQIAEALGVSATSSSAGSWERKAAEALGAMKAGTKLQPSYEAQVLAFVGAQQSAIGSATRQATPATIGAIKQSNAKALLDSRFLLGKKS